MMNLSLLQLSFQRAFIAGLLLLFVSLCRAQTPREQFDTANAFYEQQKFGEAAAGYEKLLASGSKSPEIYFNLGNAHFQNEELGKAIAAYRKAQALNPRDGDIRANLRFARAKVQNSGAATVSDSFLKWLTVNEWLLLGSVPFALCFFLLAIGQLRRDWQKIIRGYVMVLAAVTLLLGSLAAVAAAKNSSIAAVVVVNEAVVRHGPFNESQSAFILREGAELTVLDEREAWVQISAGPNRLGWVQKNQLELIR